MDNKEVFSTRKTFLLFLTILVIITTASCGKRAYTTVVLTVDSYDLETTTERLQIGPTFRINKGDELIVAGRDKPSMGGAYDVRYKGYFGKIPAEYVSGTAKKVTGDGKKVPEGGPVSKFFEPVIGVFDTDMPFGNAILLIIGFALFTIVAFFIGLLLSEIPFIGKIIFGLIVLFLLYIWIGIILGFIRSGAWVEVVVVGVLCC